MKLAVPLIVGLVLTGSASGQSHDPFDPHLNAPKMVRIQFEFIQVSQQHYLEIVAKNSKTADATAMRRRLQEMVSEDKATVLETSVVTARSGERATVESIHEFIFPSTYEPPGSLPLPLKFKNRMDRYRRLSRLARIPDHPTTFETRNLGTTFEVAPTIGAFDRMIDLQFAPELVTHAGYEVHHASMSFDGSIHQERTPYFIKNTIQTATTCIHGQYTLAGLATPGDATGQLDRSQKIMIFIRCHVLPVIETTHE